MVENPGKAAVHRHAPGFDREGVGVADARRQPRGVAEPRRVALVDPVPGEVAQCDRRDAGARGATNASGGMSLTTSVAPTLARNLASSSARRRGRVERGSAR